MIVKSFFNVSGLLAIFYVQWCQGEETSKSEYNANMAGQSIRHMSNRSINICSESELRVGNAVRTCSALKYQLEQEIKYCLKEIENSPKTKSDVLCGLKRRVTLAALTIDDIRHDADMINEKMSHANSLFEESSELASKLPREVVRSIGVEYSIVENGQKLKDVNNIINDFDNMKENLAEVYEKAHKLGVCPLVGAPEVPVQPELSGNPDSDNDNDLPEKPDSVPSNVQLPENAPIVDSDTIEIARGEINLQLEHLILCENLIRQFRQEKLDMISPEGIMAKRSILSYLAVRARKAGANLNELYRRVFIPSGYKSKDYYTEPISILECKKAFDADQLDAETLPERVLRIILTQLAELDNKFLKGIPGTAGWAEVRRGQYLAKSSADSVKTALGLGSEAVRFFVIASGAMKRLEQENNLGVLEIEELNRYSFQYLVCGEILITQAENLITDSNPSASETAVSRKRLVLELSSYFSDPLSDHRVDLLTDALANLRSTVNDGDRALWLIRDIHYRVTLQATDILTEARITEYRYKNLTSISRATKILAKLSTLDRAIRNIRGITVSFNRLTSNENQEKFSITEQSYLFARIGDYKKDLNFALPAAIQLITKIQEDIASFPADIEHAFVLIVRIAETAVNSAKQAITTVHCVLAALGQERLGNYMGFLDADHTTIGALAQRKAMSDMLPIVSSLSLSVTTDFENLIRMTEIKLSSSNAKDYLMAFQAESKAKDQVLVSLKAFDEAQMKLVTMDAVIKYNPVLGDDEALMRLMDQAQKEREDIANVILQAAKTFKISPVESQICPSIDEISKVLGDALSGSFIGAGTTGELPFVDYINLGAAVIEELLEQKRTARVVPTKVWSPPFSDSVEYQAPDASLWREWNHFATLTSVFERQGACLLDSGAAASITSFVEVLQNRSSKLIQWKEEKHVDIGSLVNSDFVVNVKRHMDNDDDAKMTHIGEASCEISTRAQELKALVQNIYGANQMTTNSDNEVDRLSCVCFTAQTQRAAFLTKFESDKLSYCWVDQEDRWAKNIQCPSKISVRSVCKEWTQNLDVTPAYSQTECWTANYLGGDTTKSLDHKSLRGPNK